MAARGAGDAWTIRRVLDWSVGYLSRKGDEHARLSAEWLLTAACGISRVEVYTSFDKPLEPDELARMHAMLERRAAGEPLQYVVGSTGFRSIEVACEPGVLIPRPETELLVGHVLDWLDREVLGGAPARERAQIPWNAEVEEALAADRAAAAAARAEKDGGAGEGDASDGVAEKPDAAAASDGEASAPGDAAEKPAEPAAPRVARVLEVGCGTGCISLSLVAERPGRVRCVATDIEPRAVALAERNREVLGISPEACDFRLGNLVAPLDREREWGSFDVLVSNPPYVPTDVMAELPREVAAFEPALALDGGADGLAIFRRLVNAAPHMLRPGGLLACELHETCLDVAADLVRAQGGWASVAVERDLARRPRYLLAQRGA